MLAYLGLAGFADSLKASWRGVLLRAGSLFLLLALLWVILAPAYAHLLAAFTSPLIPSIESSPGTRYRVEGTTIIAERPIMRQTSETVTVIRHLLRETSDDYPLALLAALVLATPVWSLKRWGSVFAVTVGLLILTQLLPLLVNIEYTKLWPQETAAGIVLSRLLQIQDDPVRLALRLPGVHGQGFLCTVALLRGDRPYVGTPGAWIAEGLSRQK